MTEYRAKRYWHVAERYDHFYSENQYGGFTQHATREQAVAAIERDIAEYGDEWAQGAQ